jgi:hypothetical protein
MIIDVVKTVAVAVIILGGLTLVVVFIRKSRANGFPTVESTSHFGQLKGAMPPTPKPDCADGIRRDDRRRSDGD